MAESDPYEVLGVKKDASDKEITRAYRRLAKRFHPDKNDDPAAEDRMKRINAAYEKIDSPEKRQKYDQESQMHNMFGRRGGNPFGGGGNPFGGGGNPFGSGGGKRSIWRRRYAWPKGRNGRTRKATTTSTTNPKRC